MLSSISEIATGAERVAIPTYSHRLYDIAPARQATIRRPDVLIVEGLHVLDRSSPDGQPTILEHIDFAVYLDAALPDLRHWYFARSAKFRRWGPTAERLWREINEFNLIEYIEPTRDAATVILVKSADHGVRRVLVRRGLPGWTEFPNHGTTIRASS
jgi:type I pantothenate kinase